MRPSALRLFSALLVIPAVSAGQGRPADPTIAANATARAVLHRALEAMGGVARVEGMGTTRRTFDFATRDRGQGARPTSPGDPGPIIETGHGEWIHDPETRRAGVEEAGTIFGGQPYVRRRWISPA